MDELARTQPLPDAPSPTQPAVETPHSRGYLLAPSDPLPQGCDVAFTLPDGARFAYAPREEGAAAGEEVQVDPFLRGNQFKPLHESPRTLAALLSIAGGRRLESGPESERIFVFLRGRGLVFMENGDTHRFEERTVGIVPPGEPAAVWAQEQDVLAVVLQPRGVKAPRRTLASEIAKRRAQDQS